MRVLARVLIRIFFRGIETEGAGRLPPDGPVIVVSNHANGLVDGLLLMSTLRRYPRFLGKSTLFKILPLRPFLALAGVIPVHRAADGSTAGNESAFAASARLLGGGGVVAIFPEGISHDESSVQPLRTGVARIALEAQAESETGDEEEAGEAGTVTGGVRIVAVGLVYDDKATFRSRALVRVGEPVPVVRWSDAYRRDARGAVRELTTAVALQLGEVSPPYASWEQAEMLAQVAEILLRCPAAGSTGDTADVDLARRSAMADRLASLDEDTARGARSAELDQAMHAYRRDLALLGLSDAQVVAAGTAGIRRALVRSLLEVAVALPFALLGVVVHAIPFLVVKQVAKRPANEGMKATVKLLGCFSGFVLTYLALAILVGLRAGALWGVAVAVGAPVCGYLDVRLYERIRRVGDLVEAVRATRDRGDVLASVAAHRDAVVRAASVLLEPV